AKLTEKHLKEIKRIFCYLRGTVNTGLWYTKDSGFELTGFSDADYAGCKDTFKSTSGGAQFLGEKLTEMELELEQSQQGSSHEVSVTDIKEKDKIEAKTGQNQAGNRNRGTVNQVKVKVKPVKTGHEFGKSTKNRSQRRKYLIGQTRPSDTPLCYLSTCELCGNILTDGTCLKCNSGAGNSFTYDPNSESFNEVQSIFNPPLQSHYKVYLSIAITFDLPNVELEDTLRIGDEHLDIILEMESDEFIKSSVENLVPNTSESEDLSDSECDVPACGNFTTFSNLLFDVDDDFSCIDDESFSDEDISKEIYSNPLFDEEIISIKIDPHHFNAESYLIESLFNHDSLIIYSSLKIDSLLNEFVGELIYLKSIPPGIDKTDCDPEE
nr:uncharacterized mitochondrial protein AtMg00810-like [Tanacetum cinerariifolium]